MILEVREDVFYTVPKRQTLDKFSGTPHFFVPSILDEHHHIGDVVGLLQLRNQDQTIGHSILYLKDVEEMYIVPKDSALMVQAIDEEYVSVRVEESSFAFSFWQLIALGIALGVIYSFRKQVSKRYKQSYQFSNRLK